MARKSKLDNAMGAVGDDELDLVSKDHEVGGGVGHGVDFDLLKATSGLGVGIENSRVVSKSLAQRRQKLDSALFYEPLGIVGSGQVQQPLCLRMKLGFGQVMDPRVLRSHHGIAVMRHKFPRSQSI